MAKIHWRRRDWAMLLVFLLWLGWTWAVWRQAPFIKTFDTHIAWPLHQSPAWLQTGLVAYTQLGNSVPVTGITVVIGLLLVWRQQQRATLFFWVNTWGLAAYGNYFIKQLIQRPRPTAWRLIEIGGYSYPSGHSTTATVLVGSLLVIAYDQLQHRSLKRGLLVGGCALILLMMISRIVVGVHYPSDTVGGVLLGSCLLYLSTRLSQGQRIGPLTPKKVD
ncbi:phospholipid phosphatase [Lactobacillus sp. CBA3606]|uniref:phosphatase PAP2 family protein n=1 Tax=Lactobacillus sp. CBA3606 TaxID=2099789 RepID=UPI000CFABFFC|nr:phosphatase PAP2 family protein [Lactobacillus sp. CBA3606]AVK62783.1 phospholipid phosphatase [Lactobacillus sp. CBA3606]